MKAALAFLTVAALLACVARVAGVGVVVGVLCRYLEKLDQEGAQADGLCFRVALVIAICACYAVPQRDHAFAGLAVYNLI